MNADNQTLAVPTSQPSDLRTLLEMDFHRPLIVLYLVNLRMFDRLHPQGHLLDAILAGLQGMALLDLTVVLVMTRTEIVTEYRRLQESLTSATLILGLLPMTDLRLEIKSPLIVSASGSTKETEKEKESASVRGTWSVIATATELENEIGITTATCIGPTCQHGKGGMRTAL